MKFLVKLLSRLYELTKPFKNVQTAHCYIIDLAVNSTNYKKWNMDKL